jgi:hypothetical protein
MAHNALGYQKESTWAAGIRDPCLAAVVPTEQGREHEYITRSLRSL